MRASARERLETELIWKKRLERWSQTDLTLEEYALEIGVDLQTFRYWRQLLARIAAGKAATTARTCAPKTCEWCRAAFVPKRKDTRTCSADCRRERHASLQLERARQARRQVRGDSRMANGEASL